MEKLAVGEKAGANAKTVLSSIKGRMLLRAFQEAGSPSEIAKRVGLPANTVHYWASKLLAANLLHQVGQTGRQRVYRAVEDTKSAEPAACTHFMANVSSALHAALLAAAERHDRGDSCDDSLEGNARFSGPQVRLLEVALTRPEYEAVVQNLLEGVPSGPVEGAKEPAPAGETYTLAVIAFRGRVSDNF